MSYLSQSSENSLSIWNSFRSRIKGNSQPRRHFFDLKDGRLFSLIPFILTLLILTKIHYENFLTSFTIGKNRLDRGLYSLEWLKMQLFPNHSTEILNLVDNRANVPNTQWQFIGWTITFLFIVGFLSVKKRIVKTLYLYVFFIVAIQFSLTYPIEQIRVGGITHVIYGVISAPLAIIGTLLRIVMYFLFPLSFLFRAYSMLVWFALGSIALLATYGLNELVSELSKRKSFVFKVKINFARKVVPSLCLVTAIVDIFLARGMLLFPEYGGDKIRAVKLVVNGISSKLFIPDYQSPGMASSPPFFLADTNLRITPSSKSRLLQTRSDAGYFGTQSNSASYWGFNWFSRYSNETEDIYESRNLALKNLCSYNFYTAIPFIDIVREEETTKWDEINTCEEGFDKVKELKEREIESSKILDSVIRLPIKEAQIKKYGNDFLYEWSLKFDKQLNSLSSNSLEQASAVEASLGSKTLHPVKGFPIDNGTFDINNWKYEKLVARLPSLTNETSLIVKSYRFKFRTLSGEATILGFDYNQMKIALNLFDASDVQLGIPCNSGLEVKVSSLTKGGQYQNLNCVKFVKLKFGPGFYEIIITDGANTSYSLLVCLYLFLGLLNHGIVLFKFRDVVSTSSIRNTGKME